MLNIVFNIVFNIVITDKSTNSEVNNYWISEFIVGRIINSDIRCVLRWQGVPSADYIQISIVNCWTWVFHTLNLDSKYLPSLNIPSGSIRNVTSNYNMVVLLVFVLHIIHNLCWIINLFKCPKKNSLTWTSIIFMNTIERMWYLAFYEKILLIWKQTFCLSHF